MLCCCHLPPAAISAQLKASPLIFVNKPDVGQTQFKYGCPVLNGSKSFGGLLLPWATGMNLLPCHCPLQRAPPGLSLAVLAPQLGLQRCDQSPGTAPPPAGTVLTSGRMRSHVGETENSQHF